MANKGRQAFNNLVKAKAKQAKAARETTTRKAKHTDEVVVSAAPVTQGEALALQPEQVQPAAQQAATLSKAPAAAKTASTREERNGVRRPRPGGKCWQVWNHLDQHGNMEAKDLRAVAEAKGWNVNNCLIELSQWRKFSGVGKPEKPTAK